ncbi:hypothetical protein Are01nite_79520 [Actinoplanes regularis]|nr:hypothetical protein Are01nite_79520 [Actinoplanes regularis]
MAREVSGVQAGSWFLSEDLAILLADKVPELATESWSPIDSAYRISAADGEDQAVVADEDREPPR